MADQTYKIKALTLAEIDTGIENLSIRIKELDELDQLKDFRGDPHYLVAQSIRVAVLEIFGQESIEFHDYGFYQIWDDDGLSRDMGSERRYALRYAL